jgi:hypothetical protein
MKREVISPIPISPVPIVTRAYQALTQLPDDVSVQESLTALNRQPEERRLEPRVVADDAGRIVFARHAPMLKCRIVDRSPSGARVRVSYRRPLPDRLTLIDPQIGATFEALIVWRHPPFIGLVFLSRRALREGPRRGWLGQLTRVGALLQGWAR